MKLTEAALRNIVKKSFDDRQLEIAEYILNSVKIGRYAEDHTGSEGIKAYFSTEGTSITAMYYDAPTLFWEWLESITSELEPYGLFVEPINSCEFGIYDF